MAKINAAARKDGARRSLKYASFAGVDKRDAFARAALRETPITVSLPRISWPQDLAPTPSKSFGAYVPGVKITTALTERADVLIILYTDLETSALLDVFTGDKTWTPARKKTWYPYAHNFAALKSKIDGISGSTALRNGEFGYLFALTIGSRKVVLYKSELHPKSNGPALPFIPVIAQLVSELAPKLVISTGTALLTFLMVFLIQNTQNRDARAINLKLNELIRAMDSARNQMIDIERLTDLELDEMQATYERVKALSMNRRTRQPGDPPAE